MFAAVFPLFVILAVFVGLAGASPSHDGTGGAGHRPTRATGGSDWLNTRLAVASSVFGAREVALSVVAHWAIETAWGKAEHNYNVGNIRPWNARQAFFVLGNVGKFLAFDSVHEGVKAYASLLRAGRYSRCLALLRASPRSPAWFQCLADSGYFGADAKVDLGFYSNVRAAVEKAAA